jgi:hypothetical protein
MPIDPVTQFLAGLHFRIHIITGRESGHKHRRLTRFTRFWIDDGHGQPGVIDFQFFPTVVRETTRGRLSFSPFPVVFAKLGVAVAVGMPISILDPQQLEGHPFFLQFLANCLPVGQRPCRIALAALFRKQLLEEFILTEPLWKGPMQPSRLGAAKILPYGAVGNLTNPSYCPVGQSGFMF